MPTEKILVDTNLLIYSIDEDSKFYKKSTDLIYKSDFQLYTSSKNISEFLSVTTASKPYSLSIKDACNLAEGFFDYFEILYPSNQSFAIFRKLILIYSPRGLKIHDYEIVSIALANDIKKIATVNEKDFSDIQEIQL